MAGGLIMIIGIAAAIMIHEAGHLVAAKALGTKASEYFVGFGPKLWSFRRGETEYGIKALPLGGYVKIVGMNPYEEVPAHEEERTYRGKSFWKKSVVVLAGIASHFVVAYLIFFGIFTVVGVHEPVLEIRQVITELDDGRSTPAAQAGLEPGDRFVAVEGRVVKSWDELTDRIAARPGEEVQVIVDREGELIGTTVTLAAVPGEEGQTIGFLGVSPEIEVVRTGPISAAGRAGGALAEVTVLSVRGLGNFFHPASLREYAEALLGGAEPAPEARPISPVGLVRVGAQAQQFGFEWVLSLVAAFNVFIGLFNLVPIYPFDGGHFTVALYEKLTGRQADIRKLMPVAAAAIALIGFLFITALYLDIVSPLESFG